MNRWWILVCLVGVHVSTIAQSELEAIIKSEQQSFIFKNQQKYKNNWGQPFNIHFQKMELTIDPAVRFISGVITSRIQPMDDGFTQFSFDLTDSMQVDSVIVDGIKTVFSHSNLVIRIAIPEKTKNEIITTQVFYRGNPSAHDHRAFSYDAQLDGPVCWTLSQPFGALGWWPCKQQLEVKIDTLEMVITAPIGNKVAGLGNLQKIDTIGAKVTYHWLHQYPIASYLVAVAVTNYYEESHYIKLSNGDSIFHIDYLYPAYKPAADTLRWAIDGMMYVFDSLFGGYPYKGEKHGHAMFGRNGGMEHQTMSFMGNLSYALMAHELAHQWFGNKITCGSWADIWLNEGFASYLTMLAYEFDRPDGWRNYMNQERDRAFTVTTGSVYVLDTFNVSRIFNANLSYRKGGLVLHMLRWKLGDSIFFKGMKDYIMDEDLCYAFAKTPDFQFFMEQASGIDLSEFFESWIYGEGYPNYVTRWFRNSPTEITFEINKSNSGNTDFPFYLSLPYLLKGEGKDSLVVIDYYTENISKTLEVGFKVEEVVFDPDLWIFAKNSLVEGIHNNFINGAIYPNPAKNELNIQIRDTKINSCDVMSIQGLRVKSFEILEKKGEIFTINFEDLAAGSYILKLNADSTSFYHKFIIQRD